MQGASLLDAHHVLHEKNGHYYADGTKDRENQFAFDKVLAGGRYAGSHYALDAIVKLGLFQARVYGTFEITQAVRERNIECSPVW